MLQLAQVQLAQPAVHGDAHLIAKLSAVLSQIIAQGVVQKRGIAQHLAAAVMVIDGAHGAGFLAALGRQRAAILLISAAGMAQAGALRQFLAAFPATVHGACSFPLVFLMRACGFIRGPWA